MKAPTYNVNATGSNVVFGNASGNFTASSVQQAEKAIEESGGDDKAELLALLNEVKEIADNLLQGKAIQPKPGLKEKLSIHFEKHGWLYGALVAVLGEGAIAFFLK